MSDAYTTWAGRSFTEGGAVTVWPVCEPDPIEAMHLTGASPITGSNQLITAIYELIQAITEQAKAITLLAESNQMLIQAMAGEEGVEEADRYQTL